MERVPLAVLFFGFGHRGRPISDMERKTINWHNTYVNGTDTINRSSRNLILTTKTLETLLMP